MARAFVAFCMEAVGPPDCPVSKIKTSIQEMRGSTLFWRKSKDYFPLYSHHANRRGDGVSNGNSKEISILDKSAKLDLKAPLFSEI